MSDPSSSLTSDPRPPPALPASGEALNHTSPQQTDAAPLSVHAPSSASPGVPAEEVKKRKKALRACVHFLPLLPSRPTLVLPAWGSACFLPGDPVPEPPQAADSFTHTAATAAGTASSSASGSRSALRPFALSAPNGPSRAKRSAQPRSTLASAASSRRCSRAPPTRAGTCRRLPPPPPRPPPRS